MSDQKIGVYMKIQRLLAPIVILFLAGNGCEEVDLELPGPGKTVTKVVIQGVPAPAYRATPVTVFDANEQYTGEVTWTPDTARFFADTEYTARIILIAKDGWTFDGLKADSFIVPGGTATNRENSGTITVVFPATEQTDDQTITLLTVPGIQIPETDMIIPTDPIETEQYTGTISWTPDTYRFQGDNVYTAHISLVDKPGWMLKGVGQNSFVVPGATTTNKADSGEITAQFPRTGKTVTISEIPAIGVTVGAIPPTAITETSQFTGTVAWTPADAAFKANTVYTAEITLTAKGAWTFAGVPSNFFTVTGATATKAADSGTVTVVFPRTGTE